MYLLTGNDYRDRWPICHNINRDFSIPGGQQLFSSRKEEERNRKEMSFPDSLALALALAKGVWPSGGLFIFMHLFWLIFLKKNCLWLSSCPHCQEKAFSLHKEVSSTEFFPPYIKKQQPSETRATPFRVQMLLMNQKRKWSWVVGLNQRMFWWINLPLE